MIEFTIRPSTRWVLTRFERNDKGASSSPICEISGMAAAENLGMALAEREGGTYRPHGPNDLEDVVLLLRRIAGQIEDGTFKAEVGVLSIRANGQKRPVVFGFGKKVDGVSECGRAAEEILRLQGVPPATKEQTRLAIKALAKIA